MNCTECGAENPGWARECLECGARVPPDTASRRHWASRALLPVTIAGVAVALLALPADADILRIPLRPALVAVLVLLLLYATAQMMGVMYGRSRIATAVEMLIWVLLLLVVVTMIWLGVWAAHKKHDMDSREQGRSSHVGHRTPAIPVDAGADSGRPRPTPDDLRPKRRGKALWPTADESSAGSMTA